MADTGLVHGFRLDGNGGGKRLDWDALPSPHDGVVWIHLDYAAEPSRAWLERASGIDPLVREALLDPDPRPRASVIGDALLLIVRVVNINPGAAPEDMVSLRCWIEPDRVVTLRHRDVRALHDLADDLERGHGPRDPSGFVAEVVERAVERVVHRVDVIDEEVVAAEDDVLAGRTSGLRTRISSVRRRAITLRRFIAPQRDALGRLPGLALPWLGGRNAARLREAADRLTRTVEELDAARDRAAVTHEELQSRLGEVTNQRLYVVAILSALFMPLGFLTAIFSVGVGGVPGADTGWAFWALIGGLVGVGILQLWLLRRWKWL